ncbi:50S ribosomal protein L14 [Candidatus Nomurabacteria bacterium]|uniref:Large ribosomal subunit protein uL14 n=1 Tax=candidate division WWE3 bacterium TaxID=2053526 RepID=A0A955DZV5_UNCKA|nr:50S ribosomal protein L14 [candidate division WWE3 bacterium]MCB9823774.1 50S ribosomal protein L14 [Candidatus Nomurabacteria bacterium]MCB9826820.1 50S ribosomal protein L14 [Candidatus Nomurabacteria bacterium]MCB9827569.1 50S ribosomal protein L14 [Candidatus Nomurabacteria bacterium]
MIHIGSVINSADNCGAKSLKVIGIPGNSKQKVAKVGDIITVVVNGASSKGVVKDHSVVKAIIVRTRKEYRRSDGTYIRFSDNAGVVINKDKNMAGTRVFGPVAREIRDRGYLKVASLAKEVW